MWPWLLFDEVAVDRPGVACCVVEVVVVFVLVLGIGIVVLLLFYCCFIVVLRELLGPAAIHNSAATGSLPSYLRNCLLIY